MKLLKTGEKSTKLYNTWRGSIHKDAEVSLPHVQGTEVHWIRHCHCHYWTQFTELSKKDCPKILKRVLTKSWKESCPKILKTLQCKNNHCTGSYHNNSYKLQRHSYKCWNSLLYMIVQDTSSQGGVMATLLPLDVQIMPKCSEWPKLPFWGCFHENPEEGAAGPSLNTWEVPAVC